MLDSMKLTQPLHRMAYSQPEAAAVLLADGRLQTWSQTIQRVSRLAAGLRALGLVEGMPVGILAGNSHRYFEYYLAVWWAGAVVLPLNSRWSAAENIYAVKDAGARMLLISREFVPQAIEIQHAVPAVTNLIYVGDDAPPAGWSAYESLIESSTPIEDHCLTGEALAGIYYTGGTTGKPKGVLLPQRALWITSLTFSGQFRMDASTRYLHVAPMFHLADGAGGLATCMAGGAHAFCPSFSPANFMRCVEENLVTHTILVPTMLGMLLDDPAFDAHKLRSLRTLIYGASPMPEGVLCKAMAALPGLSFVQVYGQTEMAALISVLTPENHVPGVPQLRSAGRVAPGLQIRIVDPEGKDVRQGEVGEVVATSPGIMVGYWNKPEETAAALRDGWVHTGDAAFLDGEGFLHIVDRLKDMIVTGGENVFSAEVESAISTHPGVAQVAVFGIPSAEWGEAVHAVVVPREGARLSEEDVVKHCAALIANYKRPKSVTIRSEQLPVSGAGKILKQELRQPFWAGRERSVN